VDGKVEVVLGVVRSQVGMGEGLDFGHCAKWDGVGWKTKVAPTAVRMNRKSPCSLLASASWLPQPIIRAWTGKLPQPQVVHHAAKSGIADIPPGTYILGSKIGYASWPRLLGETPAKQVFFFGSQDMRQLAMIMVVVTIHVRT